MDCSSLKYSKYIPLKICKPENSSNANILKNTQKRSFLSNWTCSMYIMQHFPCPTSPASCFDSCFCPQGVNFPLQLPPDLPLPPLRISRTPLCSYHPLKHNDGSAFVVLIEWRKFNYKLLHSPPNIAFSDPPVFLPPPLEIIIGPAQWIGVKLWSLGRGCCHYLPILPCALRGGFGIFRVQNSV